MKTTDRAQRLAFMLTRLSRIPGRPPKRPFDTEVIAALFDISKRQAQRDVKDAKGLVKEYREIL